jgi:hypothetical protein
MATSDSSKHWQPLTTLHGVITHKTAAIIRSLSMCGWRWGLDWWHDLLTTYTAWLGTTSNYSTIANLHNSQTTAANTKSSQSFTNRFPVTDLNNEDSSASVLTSLLSGEFEHTHSYFKTGSLSPVSLDDNPFETHGYQFFFQLNTCCYTPCVTSSLTRG